MGGGGDLLVGLLGLVGDNRVTGGGECDDWDMGGLWGAGGIWMAWSGYLFLLGWGAFLAALLAALAVATALAALVVPQPSPFPHLSVVRADPKQGSVATSTRVTWIQIIRIIIKD